jgi:hypothetical protein
MVFIIDNEIEEPDKGTTWIPKYFFELKKKNTLSSDFRS